MINYLQLQPAAGGLICPYRAEAVSLSANWKKGPLAFPIISPSLHAPLGLGLRGEQERERRYIEI